MRGSCPGDFPDNFHLEVLDHRHRRGRSVSRVTRRVAAVKLEVGDLLLPSHNPRAKTRSALSPHRSLASHRHHHNPVWPHCRDHCRAAARRGGCAGALPPRGTLSAPVSAPWAVEYSLGCRRATWAGRGGRAVHPGPATDGRPSRQETASSAVLIAVVRTDSL